MNEVSPLLLRWYDRYRRHLPWRAEPGEQADPYRVWLSEIMLQQTTVPAVISYFVKFTTRWPTVAALAAAPLEDVLQAWAGLGYYARARNLHKCANQVARDHGGRFPETEAELQALPGIGPYTAAAIAAIAFNRATVPVDGNIERIVARLFAIRTALPQAKTEILEAAAKLATSDRAGDFAQGLMDLGSSICQPKKAQCELCPLPKFCQAHAEGLVEQLPRKAPKALRPTRHALAFLLTKEDGAILLRRRPPKGLLGGMLEVPSTDWRGTRWSLDEALPVAPHAKNWRLLDAEIEHTFTHFHLIVRAATARLTKAQVAKAEGIWCPPKEIEQVGLPSIMLKIARLHAP